MKNINKDTRSCVSDAHTQSTYTYIHAYIYTYICGGH